MAMLQLSSAPGHSSEPSLCPFPVSVLPCRLFVVLPVPLSRSVCLDFMQEVWHFLKWMFVLGDWPPVHVSGLSLQSAGGYSIPDVMPSSGREWDLGVLQLSARTSQEIPWNPLPHPYCQDALEFFGCLILVGVLYLKFLLFYLRITRN